MSFIRLGKFSLIPSLSVSITKGCQNVYSDVCIQMGLEVEDTEDVMEKKRGGQNEMTAQIRTQNTA